VSKPRRHTTCIVCGKQKKPPAKLQAGTTKATFLEDPYCSRVCCERDHGITDTKPGTNTSTALRPMVEPQQRPNPKAAA
jgi:hypothetical protein